MKRRIGGYIGAALGFQGWLIGIVVLCLTSGHAAVLRSLVLPGFAINLAMAGVLVVSLEVVRRTYGLGGRFQLILWGELTFFMGTLYLLINHWITPIIMGTPGLADTARRLGGGGWAMSDVYPSLLLLVSAGLLGAALVVVGKTRRQPGDL